MDKVDKMSTLCDLFASRAYAIEAFFYNPLSERVCFSESFLEKLKRWTKRRKGGHFVHSLFFGGLTPAQACE